MQLMKILAVTIGGLGDAILFSPVIKAVRARYPQARIHLLVASKLAKSAYTDAAEIDRIVCLDANSRRSVRLALEMVAFCLQSRWWDGGYDLGVYATGLNPKLSGTLKIFAGIRKTVSGSKPPEHPTDLACNLALAHRFETGVTAADAFVPIPEAAEAEASQTLQAAGIGAGERLLAIYPSTNLAHRPRWALSNFIAIIRKIKKQHFQGKIVVLGNRTEGRDWLEADGEKLVDANLAGQLSISGSAAVLRRCCLTIGNDGGLMHVAGAVGSPVVVVMVNAPLSYRPPGSRTTVIHSPLDCCSATYPVRPDWCHDARCRQSIPADEVFRACAETLKQTIGTAQG